MYGACHELLSRAAFSVDEDGKRRARGARDRPADVLDGRTHPDELGIRLDIRQCRRAVALQQRVDERRTRSSRGGAKCGGTVDIRTIDTPAARKSANDSAKVANRRG